MKKTTTKKQDNDLFAKFNKHPQETLVLPTYLTTK